MRICSFLPSATEIVAALGLEDSLVGVTYECDYPPTVKERPVVVKTRLPETSDPAEIDRLVRDYMSRGESLYRVDADVLREGAPELIVTQELCNVCAATPGDLETAATSLETPPSVLSLHPHRVGDILDDIERVGDAADRREPARRLTSELRERLAAVERAVDRAETRPRVVCLEWIEPPYVGGHWVPEMVQMAGGVDVLGPVEKPSFRVTWEQIASADPDVVVVMPCGYGLREAVDALSRARLPEEWGRLRAVRSGRAFAVDANSYFSRPGPRVVDGVEILASLLHPNGEGIPAPPAESFKSL